MGADVTILNSGTLRADKCIALCCAEFLCCSACVAQPCGVLSHRTIGPGNFTMQDLFALLPLDDAIVLLGMSRAPVWWCLARHVCVCVCVCVPAVTGQDILDALNNGVSQYPKLEGRFPLVSGLVFEFTPVLPAGVCHNACCRACACACACACVGRVSCACVCVCVRACVAQESVSSVVRCW